MAPPTKPRRWPRFGIRSILVVMVLVHVPLAWTFNRVRAQRRAVEAIENAGGFVMYDYQDRPAPVGKYNFDIATFLFQQAGIVSDANPPGPLFLRQAMGDDLFATVARVSIDLPKRMESIVPAVDAIPKLHGLTHLYLFGAEDNGLARLTGPRSLTEFEVKGDFTSEGLGHLQSFSSLRTLSIESERWGDSDVDALVDRIRSVRELTIVSDQITNASLRRLATCTWLESLTVLSKQVTYEGDQRLQKALPACKVSIGRRRAD